MTAEKLDAWSKDLAERATIISHAKSGLIALMIDMAFEHDEKAVKPRKLKRKVIHDRLVACGYTPEQKEIVRSYTVFKDYDSRIFDKLVDAYARDAKTDGPHADYGRIVSIAAFHYYVAKAHYHVHTQNPDSKDARIIISYVKKAKEALAKTGVSEAAVAAVDDLVRAAHPPEYPRHVLRHIAAIEEEHDREQKRLDQARSVFAESLKKTREPLMLTGGTIRPPS